MATKVRGITIEIGGDASGLEKSLKEVNSEIKNTSSQLKDVEKLLKLDPKNTDLLEQKYRLLGETIGETERKLQTLREAEKEMQQAVRDGKASQEQYDALRREIADTEIALGKLKDAQNEFASSPNLELISKTFTDVGDKISAAGDKLLKVTGAIAGLGGLAVKTSADFDEGMSKVQAISGASEEDMAALIEKAREMGASTKFSASEAAEALTYMAMAGWKTEDMLSGIEGIMNLAAASGEELGTTSDIVTDALTAFGLSAEDSARFADILAAASSNSNTNVAMMGETFKYVAPIAGALGYSVEDVATAIGILANNGIKSSQAGTSLRRIFTALNGKVELASESMGDMVIETVNADGSMRDLSDILADLRTAFGQMTDSEKAANAENIAGKNALSGFLALVEAAPSDVEKLSKAIDNSNGSAKDMSEIMMDNLNGRLTILKSTLEETAIGFGELLMPAIEDVVGWIKDLLDWVNSLDEDTKNMITTVGLIVAALGPLLSVVGRLSTAIGILLQHPYVTLGLIIVGAIAGIVTAIKDVKSESEIYLGTIKEETDAIKTQSNAISDNANAYLDSIDAYKEHNKAIEDETDHLQALWEHLQDITDAQGYVMEGHENEAKFILNELNEAFDLELELLNGRIEGYESAKTAIDEMIESMRIEALLASGREAYQEAVKKEPELWKDLADAQKLVDDASANLEVTQTRLAEIQKQFDDGLVQNAGDARDLRVEEGMLLEAEKLQLEALNEAKEALRDASEAYGAHSSVIENYENAVVAAKDGTGDIQEAIARLSGNLRTAENADLQTLKAQARDYKEQYEQMQRYVDAGGRGISEKQLNTMKKMAETAEKEVSTMMRNLSKEVDGSYSAFKNSGENIAKGFAKGIQDYTSQAVSAAGSMARQARDRVNSVLGVASPSKVMMETGKYVDQGFAEGIMGNLRYVTDAATAMTQPLTDMDLAMQDSLQAQTMAAGITQPIIIQLTQPINLGGKLIGQSVTENVIRNISGRQELEAAYMGW